MRLPLHTLLHTFYILLIINNNYYSIALLIRWSPVRIWHGLPKTQGVRQHKRWHPRLIPGCEKGNVKIAELIESLNDSDTREDSRLVFEDTARGWEAKAA